MKIRVVLSVLLCSFVNLCAMEVKQPMPRTASAVEISAFVAYAISGMPLSDCPTTPVAPPSPKKPQKDSHATPMFDCVLPSSPKKPEDCRVTPVTPKKQQCSEIVRRNITSFRQRP